MAFPHHEKFLHQPYRKETREPGMVDYDDVENFYDLIRDDGTDSNDLQKRMFSQYAER